MYRDRLNRAMRSSAMVFPPLDARAAPWRRHGMLASWTCRRPSIHRQSDLPADGCSDGSPGTCDLPPCEAAHDLPPVMSRRVQATSLCPIPGDTWRKARMSVMVPAGANGHLTQMAYGPDPFAQDAPRLPFTTARSRGTWCCKTWASVVASKNPAIPPYSSVNIHGCPQAPVRIRSIAHVTRAQSSHASGK